LSEDFVGGGEGSFTGTVFLLTGAGVVFDDCLLTSFFGRSRPTTVSGHRSL